MPLTPSSPKVDRRCVLPGSPTRSKTLTYALAAATGQRPGTLRGARGDDPMADVAECDQGGDGSHRGVFDAGVSRPARVRTVRAGADLQRRAREECAGPQDRRRRRGLVGRAARVWPVAGQLHPRSADQAVRDLTRYRKRLVGERSSETQRLGAVLQDAGIKLDSVASSLSTVSARSMIDALIDGERRGAALAELARGRMRAKIPDLVDAQEGRFDEHHALMCRLHLEHIDHLDEMIARLDAQVEQMMVPFTAQRDLLVTIPGIGARAAAAILTEIGAHPAEYFASDAHLASWTGLCPGNHESAGKRKHGTPHKANQHVKPILVEAAWSAVKTSTRLRARYHRLVLRFGGYRNPAAKKKAIVAIAHTLIVIVWHVLTANTAYADLGADFYDRRTDPAAQTRRLVAKLQALGHIVTLESAA
ncbi:IS110 family transposase [Rhodococcus opacus]|nr:IS110 family transposase [Rhodococcus opacus]